MDTYKNHDTWINAVPFADGTDRRQSIRVPCAMEVRLGPPKLPAETSLVVEYLSLGGLFIRCSQPVQVGARFSVELALPDDERLYVPEAEVLYNVQDGGPRRGFGARFVSLTREALATLHAAARFESDLLRPEPASDLPTTSSMILSSEALESLSLPRPPAPKWRAAQPRISDLRLASLRPIRDRVAKAIDGAIQRFTAVSERPEIIADTAPPAPVADTAPPAPRILDSEIPILSEREDMHDGIDWKPREVMEREQRIVRRVSRRAGQVLGSRPMLWAVAAAAGLAVMLVGASLISNGAGPGDALASDPAAPPRLSAEIQRALLAPKPVAEQPPAPAPVMSPAPKMSEALLATTVPSPSPLAALDRKVEELKKAKDKPRASANQLAFEVDAGARVLQTHVLKQPARFVVDLTGQKKAPIIREHGTSTPRFGIHPDFVRIVIDSPKPIERGEVSLRAHRLEIKLSPR